MAGSQTAGKIQTALQLTKSTSLDQRRRGTVQLMDLTLSSTSICAQLYAVPGVVDAFVNAAQQDDSETKLAGLSGLHSFTTAPENVQSLCANRAVVDAFVNASMKKGKFQHAGIEALFNLTTSPANCVRMFPMHGVLDAFVHVASSSSSDAKRKSALVGLANMAIARENKARMAETPGVVDVMVKACRDGESNQIKLHGVQGLRSLANVDDTLLSLGARTDVLDAFLRAYTKGETKEIKQHGMEGLVRLSGDLDTGIRLAGTSGVLEAFSDAATTTTLTAAGTTNKLKTYGLLGLSNLSVQEAVAVRLFDFPGIIKLMLAVSLGREDDLNKWYAITAFAHMTTHFGLNRQLCAFPGVVDAMISWATNGRTAQVRSEGLRALWNLSGAPDIAEIMFAKHALLPSVLDVEPNVSVACILVNLAIVPKAREVMRTDPAVVEYLLKLNRFPGIQIPLLAKLAWAILAGPDNKQSETLRIGEPALKQILKALEASMQSRTVFGHHWSVNSLFGALRNLTMVAQNRLVLGNEWLVHALWMIDLSVFLRDVESAECAVDCVVHYARANPNFTQYDILIEVADRWLRYVGTSHAVKFEQIFFDAQSWMMTTQMSLGPRIKDEIRKICAGLVLNSNPTG